MKRKLTTIDEYLAAVTGERRAALDKLRKTICAIVPKAEECISYGIPAFRLDGRIVADGSEQVMHVRIDLQRHARLLS
jgi:uncharacterized protein YdhG (YjbR/CyaY superfamily)